MVLSAPEAAVSAVAANEEKKAAAWKKIVENMVKWP